MTVFRRKNWIREIRVRVQNLTAKVKQPRIYKERLSRLLRWVTDHKIAIAKGSGAVIILVGISAGGNQYIGKNTYEIFHVFVNGQEIGVVNDPGVIDQAVQERRKEVQSANPDVHMVLDTSKISYTSEKVFKGQYDNEAAALTVKRKLDGHATGVKLMVNGKQVAVLKDREQANAVLDEFKQKYGNVDKKPSKVEVLSAEEAMAPISDNKILKSVEFTQEVELQEAFIEREELQEPSGVLAALEAMGEPPQTYIVQEGDCIGCIAEKFNTTSDEIRELNVWIVDDMIRVGDELIVKGFEPTLGVRTVEVAVEEEEIQYDTVYETDKELRLGKTRVIKPGKYGLKKVTYELTSINGNLIKEEQLNEVTLVEPVTAVVAKGTLRLRGEGTGKFSWPVSGAKVTSSFGKRWGKQHEGIDMASSNRTIMAADTGKVIFAGTKNGYGKTVIIDHQNGYTTLYAHMSKLTVTKGEVVEKGDKIGVMGSTGHSTGVHLHFEVHLDGKLQNPSKYLRR